MTLREFISGELIDIVEWLETGQETMVSRFYRPHNEIKNGAQLIVRPGQKAVFVEQGTVADVFLPGRHELATKNLPVLSRLKGWKYGFESPFKAEVVFVSTRQFAGAKWGTKAPVMTTDPQLGPVRLRAFGTYAIRVSDPECFVRELVGANPHFAIDQVSDQLRDLMVARFSDLLGEQSTSVLALASQYDELGAATAKRLAEELARFGLEVTQFNVESIALPDEVAATLDQRTRMGLLGDVGAYAQLQAADAMLEAARNPGGGAAAAGVGIGAGVALGQQMAHALPQTAPQAAPKGPPPIAAPAGPPPIPSVVFYLAVNGAPVGPLDRPGLEQQVRNGVLRADTLVWRDGMAEWMPASRVPELSSLLPG